jgi:hypothetical protein
MAVLDAATDGALSDLREYILPDAERMLRKQFQRANDDTMIAVTQVVRVLVARAHGVEPSDALVSDFINSAAADPAFAARTARLLSQAVRTPNAHRRRNLALALFRPHPDPSVRDEVDAAVEGLEPTSIELLRTLIGRDLTGAGFKVAQPGRERPAKDSAGGVGAAFSIGRAGSLVLLTEGGTRLGALECSVGSVLRLRSARPGPRSTKVRSRLRPGPPSRCERACGDGDILDAKEDRAARRPLRL